MTAPTLRRFITALTFSFISAAVAHGQSSITASWQGAAQELTGTRLTVYVVTTAHPNRRHACRVNSINDSEIICTHPGHTTTFKAGDIAALIFPGEHTRWYLYFAGFLAAGGAATWGTVVLAAVCPVCAVATGVAALFFYVAAPATAFLTDGDSADSLLYLAPGQTLQVRLD